MLSCWERLPWESLWHKPKEMLIAEPYEASHPCPKRPSWPWPPLPEASPPTLPMIQGPHFSPAPGTQPCLEKFWKRPCAQIVIWTIILDWPHTWLVATPVPDGHWPVYSTQHCSLTPRDPSHVRLLSPLVYVTNAFEHFFFQGLALILVFSMVWLEKFLSINIFQHLAEML